MGRVRAQSAMATRQRTTGSIGRASFDLESMRRARPPAAALRLRALGRALPGLRRRPREHLARGRAPPCLRGPRGADRGRAGRRGREPHEAEIEADVLRFLGLPFDLDGFDGGRPATRCSPGSSAALAGSGRRSQPDPFEALVTSITAQQVSLQSAAAIRSRFIERYGVPAVHAHAFPTRERVARATEDELIASRLLHPQG